MSNPAIPLTEQERRIAELVRQFMAEPRPPQTPVQSARQLLEAWVWECKIQGWMLDNWAVEELLQVTEQELATMPIEKAFAYHKPSPDGLTKVNALREAFSAVKAAIETHCPESRQRSVALTELETAAMWAIKAVVFNDPQSEVL